MRMHEVRVRLSTWFRCFSWVWAGVLLVTLWPAVALVIEASCVGDSMLLVSRRSLSLRSVVLVVVRAALAQWGSVGATSARLILVFCVHTFLE